MSNLALVTYEYGKILLDLKRKLVDLEKRVIELESKINMKDG